MIVGLRHKTKGYLKADEMRMEGVKENRYSETFNEVIKQMFAVDSINKLKQMLEDVCFHQNIPNWVVEKFYDCIKQEKLTVEDFINEYNISAEQNGYMGVFMMLGVL